MFLLCNVFFHNFGAYYIDNLKDINMKRFFQLTVAAVAMALALTACNINDDYDLSKLDGGNFALGDEDSVFNLPLATVSIDVDKLLDGETVEPISYSRSEDDSSSITAQLDLLAALLPSEDYFPGGVDLEKLTNTDADDYDEYKDSVLDALIEELADDEDKRLLLSEELLTNEELADSQETIFKELGYSEEEITALQAIENPTDEDFKSLASSIETTVTDEESAKSLKSTISSEISEADAGDTSLLDQIKEAIDTSDNTSDTITIDDVSIDQSIIDMLKDGSNEIDIKLYYSFETNITANFDLDISLLFGDSGELKIGKDKDDSTFESITDNDTLNSILNDLKIYYAIKFSTYSGSNSKDARYINLKLMAKKKGALILE